MQLVSYSAMTAGRDAIILENKLQGLGKILETRPWE